MTGPSANTVSGKAGALTSQPARNSSANHVLAGWTTAADHFQAVVTNNFLAQLAIVFLGYFIAGKLGQATTNVRSGNLGPVWPAFGIALAGILAYGPRAWPAVFASAFVVAFQSPVSALTAAGQAAGATIASVTGAVLLRRVPQFDPALSRLRDALALILIGAFGAATISASIGVLSLSAMRFEAYSGFVSAWLIYWLGDATGVLLVTPLCFTLPALRANRSRQRMVELTVLLSLLAAACFLIFGDLPLVPVRLHVLAFAVVPFVMWAAIRFGVGGASLSVFVVATIATLLTAFGHGPFSTHTPFINAALLDVLFTVLAITGLSLAAVIVERERSDTERERLAQTEAAHSRVSGRLIEAQEQERSRIARELHDDIGQRLALLTLNLTGLAQSELGSSALQRRTTEIKEQASQLAADIQSMSHHLHSPRLALLGIAATMQRFCEEFAGQYRVTVDFESRAVPDGVTADVALCLYRILQEGLRNAAKHSGVQRFEVRLWGTPVAIHLTVKDTGQGFDRAAAARGAGIGLLSMEERIKLVAGELSIESEPERGTTIHARVPFSPSES
jgi:signal transduction histidine kinase